MISPQIRTYEDLLREKQRLAVVLEEDEQAIREEFKDIKRKFKPVKQGLDFLEKITTRDSNNPLVRTGIDVGVNLIVKKLLLRNAGWVAKLVMPFVLKNFLSHEAQEHPEWMQKLTNFFKKTFGKKNTATPPADA